MVSMGVLTLHWSSDQDDVVWGCVVLVSACRVSLARCWHGAGSLGCKDTAHGRAAGPMIQHI